MKQNFDADVLVIGLGPAGMAVSQMGNALGLKVIAIEKRKIGGECLNIGCIPSKAILKAAKLRHLVKKFPEMGLQSIALPLLQDPFKRVREVVREVNEGKTAKMFENMDVVLGMGHAQFIDSHTVEVPGVRTVRAKKIFICTGTTPNIPPIAGIDKVPILTNENIFDLKEIPKSMTVIGGGAIGCEMSQALSRLGASVTILNADPCLMPRGDIDASTLLCSEFDKEGISVINNVKIEGVSGSPGDISVRLADGRDIKGEALLVAAGRRIVLDSLRLENAGINYDKRSGIVVDQYLRTSQPHIYAIGDCNGYRMFTHSAMHQGMLAVMNSMSPKIFKRRYKDYLVPWSVFTEPEISQVGETERELQSRNVRYEVVQANYSDYGRATADGSEVGFVKVLVSPWGKILGATIAGEGSSEMIHEFAFAIQSKKSLISILFLQHSFPSFSFLNKRIAEIWLMKKVKSEYIRRTAAWAFKVF